MATHPTDDLAEHALGTLAPTEAAAVELHVAQCVRCADELAVLRSSLGVLADAVTPLAPSTRLRDGLLALVDGRLRHAPFAGRVAALFHLDPDDALRALEGITEPSAWRATPFPGMQSAKVRAGATLAGAPCFLRFDAGARCENHRHVGEERILILAGGFREDDGTEAHAGDLVLRPPGSTHAFVALPGEPCVAAYVIEGGVERIEAKHSTTGG